MTINLTIISRFGVWQASDHRLSYLEPRQGYEDRTVKHVVLRCADGVALIAYAGLALIDAGLGLVEISDWVRESLRGETRLLEPSLVVLRVNATRDLGPLCRHLRLPHMFTIGILAAGVPWIVQIRNFTIDERGKAGSPSATFTTHGARVEEGRAFGFPGQYMVPDDIRTLERGATKTS